MTTNLTASCAHLDNAALLRATGQCVGKCRQALGDLLRYLGEIDARGLYREQGCNSLFGFCRYLGFSESESQKRVMAARLVRRWPRAVDALVAGRVHLTGLSMLGTHVDKPQIERWLEQAEGKSKQEIADMLASAEVCERRPPDVLRRLPRLGGDTAGRAGLEGTAAAGGNGGCLHRWSSFQRGRSARYLCGGRPGDWCYGLSPRG